MKRFCLIVTIAALSACASPSLPSINPPSQTSPAITGTPSKMLTGVIGSRATSSALSPRETIAIRSIGIIGIINGQKLQGYVPVTCKATDRSGVATGCGIYAKQTLHIKKMAAGLFHGPKATGCLVAAGKWHGTVTTGQTIPVKFFWTGNC